MSTLPFDTLEEMAAWQLSQRVVSVGNAESELPAGTGAPHATGQVAKRQRQHGPKAATHPRHMGATHAQHPAHKATGHTGAHKTTHPHAARVHKAKTAGHAVDHAHTRPHKQGAGHHHPGIHRTKVHLASVPGALGMEVGTVVAYSPPSASSAGAATVQLQGSAARVIPGLPMTQGLPADLQPLGAQCLVAMLDPANPADALVVGVYNAPPARLWQGEGQNVTCNAAQVTQHITFPNAFVASVHAVVATSQDPAWTVAVRNLTLTGFDLVLTTVGHNPGLVGTPRLVQGEGQTVSVGAGASQATQHVTFGTSYATLHSVVATSQDPAWHAIARNLSTTGFDLVVQNVLAVVTSDATYNTPNPDGANLPVVKQTGAVVGQQQAGGGGVNVTVDWLASGEVAYNSTVTVDWVACGI